MIDIKTKRQNEAIAAVRNNGYNGAILCSVGFGKGRVMLELVKELIAQKGIKSVLYLCDNTRLKEEDFPKEVKRWGDTKSKKIIHLECYQTAHRWKDKHFDLVLGDEFDFAITEKYVNVFFNNSFTYKILASGTLSPEKRKIAETIVPIVYKYTTTQGEQEGLLNKTKYYLYNYRMNESECEQYRKWTKAYVVAQAAEKSIKTLNFLLNKRRDVLYTLESSYQHARKIMSWLWNRNKKTRLVIFCERKSQADRICKWSYHGGNEGEENLDKFQRGEISGIAVVSKVKRGINLKNANTALMEAINGSSSTEFEQENGRMKRLPVSEIATVILMVPWYSKVDDEGEIIWKPTVVNDWVYKATCNLKDIEFINLKL